MRDHGFEYYPPPYDQLLASARGSEASRAERFPYDAALEGMPYRANDPAQQLDRSNDEYVAALSSDAQARYAEVGGGSWDDVAEVDALANSIQTPKGGRLSEARAELFGSVETSLLAEFAGGNLQNIIFAAVEADPVVMDAIAAWSTCMGGRGYDFEHFGEARGRARTSPPDAEAIASADAACTSETDLATAYRSAYDEEVQVLAEQYAAQLAESNAATAAALQRAQQALGG